LCDIDIVDQKVRYLGTTDGAGIEHFKNHSIPKPSLRVHVWLIQYVLYFLDRHDGLGE
jgi:hypothetical protein